MQVSNICRGKSRNGSVVMSKGLFRTHGVSTESSERSTDKKTQSDPDPTRITMHL